MLELIKQWWRKLHNEKGLKELGREVDALAAQLKNSSQNNK